MMALPHLRAIRVVVLLVAFVEALGTAATLVERLVTVNKDSPLTLALLANTDGRTTMHSSITMIAAVAWLVEWWLPVVNLFQIYPTLNSSAAEVRRWRAWLILAPLRIAAPIAPCHESVQCSLREVRHHAGI